MNPISLTIKAFKSFIDEQEFRFPTGAGLFFLMGDNQTNPRLGANAVGKSTLWDALCWVLFDKTPKGMKAGDVSPWSGEKGTRVDFTYESNQGETWMVSRTWSPNRWWLTDPSGEEELLTSDSSNLLHHHLGLDFVPFSQSVLMAQGRPMFLDLKPDAASALFSQVMDLDHWLDQSVKASQKANEQDVISRKLESLVSRIKGQLSGLSDSDLRQTSDEWERDQAKRLASVEADYKRQLGELETLKDSLAAAQVSERDARGFLREAVDRASKFDVQGIDDLDDRIRQTSSDLAVINSQLKDVEAKSAHLASHAGSCESCGQLISDEYRESELDFLMMGQQGLLARLRTGESLLNRITDQKKDLKRSSTAARLDVEESQDVLDKASREVRRIENQILQVNKILDRLEDQDEELSAQKNPVGNSLRAMERRRQSLLDELDRAEADLAESERKYRLYQFWIKGFKEIRLTQISEALIQLEIEVNSCVTQLGLTGWRLLFESDSETKGGKIKRGFAVKVLSPENTKAVSWDSWSGGEAQRLRLAGNMGMANLIRDRTGATIPLEVWDEPTQGLSPQGVLDLLDSLKQRAISEGRQIWLVDHRSPGYGDFDGTVLVVKDERGSVFDMSGCISA